MSRTACLDIILFILVGAKTRELKFFLLFNLRLARLHDATCFVRGLCCHG
jgi:hypothetical protein